MGHDGTLYVSDVGNRSVRRIDPGRRRVDTLATGLMQPWGLCVDAGALLVADSLQESVLRIDLATGTQTAVAGSNRFGYAGATSGPGRAARFRTPRGIDCGKDAVYLADRGNAELRRLDRTTWEVTTLAGSIAGGVGYRDGQGIYALFREPQSTLAWDDRTIYVGDEGALRAVSRPDGMVTTAAGVGERLAFDLDAIERRELLQPEGIAIADGSAFVSGGHSWAIHRVNLMTGESTVFAGSPESRGFGDAWGVDARFGAVSAIAGDGRGTLFVADPDNHAVRAVRVATRRVETIAGAPMQCGNDDGSLLAVSFCEPAGVAFGDGALYVADASAQTIRRIDLAGRAVATIAGKPFTRGDVDGAGDSARLSSPAGLVFAEGALFVADRENGVVRRVDLATHAVTTVGGARFDRPTSLALTSTPGTLLVGDRASVSLLVVATGARTRLAVAGPGLRLGSVAPSLGYPTGIVELGPGDALVVDRSESAVLRLAY